MTIYHSGDPLDIRVSASQLNTGGATGPTSPATQGERPPHPRLAQWFDTNPFADPVQYQFGNYKYSDARGPRVFNTDVSLSKRTAIGKGSLEQRIDVFNLFNRAHFANPGLTFGTSAFGTISATRLTPREAQVGLCLLF
jgi:hypothetical protein